MWFLSGSNTRTKEEIEKIKFETQKMIAKHPNRVIVYVDKLKTSSLPEIKNKKYLVPNDMTLTQFSNVIRNNIKLNKESALFYFIGDNHTIPTMTSTLGELYEKYKSEDERLYIYYETESVFG